MIELVAVCLACGLGGVVHAAAGFGSALVAMPIVTQVIGVRAAAPTQAILGLIISALVLRQNWHALRWREAAPLMAGAVVGVPLGTFALKSFPESVVTGCLGVMLLGYGVFEFWNMRRGASLVNGEAPANGGEAPAAKRGLFPSWWGTALASVVGFSAGIVGGAYAADGPPLIIYGSVKRWPKGLFKSVLQSCFLISGTTIVICHGAGGLITKEVGLYCVAAIPGLAVGMVVGNVLDRRLDHARFRRMVLWLILVLGVTLVGRVVL